jgi:transketolase
VRNAFLDALVSLAERDERVMLLTGDLGFSVLEPFAERFPDRFVNCGVAEQNMTGVATGLAEAGMVPFTYSIATFATLRPYEFIRNGAALHRLPVRVVGVGGGFDYGHNGITHFALEDYAVMRTQPEIGVIAPADGRQARAALDATADHPGPLYFRISKVGAELAGLDGRFRHGGAELIGDGKDVALIAIGSVSHSAAGARELLAERGIATTLAVVSSLNPDPVEDLAELLADVPVALTVEAHYRNGGLGSAVAELIAERGLGTRLHRAAVDRMPIGVSGTQGYLEDRYGLSPERLAEAAAAALSLV